MSRYIPKTEKPKVYESVMPAEQIKVLAQGILSDATVEGTEIARNVRRTEWQSRVDGKFYGVEIRILEDVPIGAPTAHYIVDSYTSQTPTRKTPPEIRFLASDYDTREYSSLHLLKNGSDKLEPPRQQRQNLVHGALRALILHAQPDIAWQAVNTAMDAHYQRVIESYVLSDDLLQGNVLSSELVKSAVKRHLQHMHHIVRNELEVAVWSGRSESYMIAVIEAMDSKPRSHLVDRYKPVAMPDPQNY